MVWFVYVSKNGWQYALPIRPERADDLQTKGRRIFYGTLDDAIRREGPCPAQAA